MKYTTTATAIIALSGAAVATPSPSGLLLDDIKDNCDPYDPNCQPAGPFLNHLVDSSEQFAKLIKQDGLVDDAPYADAKYQLPTYSPEDYNEDDMYEELPYKASESVSKYGGSHGKEFATHEDYNDLYDNEDDDTYDEPLAEHIPTKMPSEMEPKKLYPRSMLDTDTGTGSADGNVPDVDPTGVDYTNDTVAALPVDIVDDTESLNATVTSFDIVNSTDTASTGAQQDGASIVQAKVLVPLCTIVAASVGAACLL